MANFNRKKDAVASIINKVAQEIATESISVSGAEYFKNPDLTKFVSTESIDNLSDSQLRNYESSMEGIADFLRADNLLGDREFLNVIGVESVNDIPQHSMEAAQILVAASGNLQEYNLGQLRNHTHAGVPQLSQEQIFTGDYGSLSISPEQNSIATESFDEKELTKYLQYSIIYNVMASRQDPLNEMFFRPLTVTQDEIGYRVSVRVEEVWNGSTHDPDGTVLNIIKEKLIDALVHPEILEANGTEVIPYVQSGGTIDNTDSFVDASLVAPYDYQLENVTVKTAPLKIGEKHSLLGLSSHPALIAGGLMGDKDSLDGRIALKAVYVKVGEKVVKYDTSMLYRSGFYKTPEGDMNTMSLTFTNGSFLANKQVLTIAGEKEAIKEFKDLSDAGYDVRLELRLSGEARRDHGYVDIAANPVRISSVQKDGKRVPFDKKSLADNQALKTLLEAVTSKAEVIGYDIEARRTNYNLRTRGRLIDSTEYTEQITIPLRSPISIVKPIVGAEKEHPDVKSLVNATRIMSNNDGVKTILNHARLMEQIVSRDTYDYQTDRDSFPGIGRHFIQPVYIREVLDLPKMINSVSSESRLKDIQGAISTKLNELVSRVLQQSNYIPVVEQMTGGNIGKVKVIMGTDYRLPQYLNIQGDTRLFGGKIDYQIESTANKHLRNKVVLSLSRVASEEGPDPFSYGTYVWTPELMVSTTLDRGGSKYHQHLVQPRYLHIVNIPILVELDIVGLEEVTGESTVMVTTSVTKDEAATLGNGLATVETKEKELDKSKPVGSEDGATATPSGTGKPGK